MVGTGTLETCISIVVLAAEEVVRNDSIGMQRQPLADIMFEQTTMLAATDNLFEPEFHII